MRVLSLDDDGLSLPSGARWALVYSSVEAPFSSALQKLAAAAPAAEIFGSTSFRGVLLPTGFRRGVFALVGEAGDPRAVQAVRASSAGRARADARAACAEIRERLGKRPDVLLLHATPGFEERILDGVSDAFDDEPPPLYGGSAADDDLSGKWRVLSGTQAIAEGFVLVGFASDNQVHGSFVAGYMPTERRGRVTAASGRRVATIDGRPAARVYNEWLEGTLSDVIQSGGNVLARTTLHPLGRMIDKVGQVPRYLLSHPHQLHEDGTLSFFTDIAVGEELSLMLGSEAALLDRTDQVAARAGRGAGALRGGILIYCAGCVGMIGHKTSLVAERFSQRIQQAPFIGASTYGEQGCFIGTSAKNRHGNLMCDAILFE